MPPAEGGVEIKRLWWARGTPRRDGVEAWFHRPTSLADLTRCSNSVLRVSCGVARLRLDVGLRRGVAEARRDLATEQGDGAEGPVMGQGRHAHL